MGGLNVGTGKVVGAAAASDAADAEAFASDAFGESFGSAGFGPLLLLERFGAAPPPTLTVGATG